MKRVAIFASGTGTNADKIIKYFYKHPTVEVALIVCNKPDAGVLDIAAKHGIETLLIEKEIFNQREEYIIQLKKKSIEWIVLAGFLWKMPVSFVTAFPNRIINIHPALLPKYGGKGMYGMRVHEAILAAGEQETGITIHYVNEHYDEGAIIFQASCAVEPGDTPETVAQKVHVLEHAHFAPVIERLLSV